MDDGIRAPSAFRLRSSEPAIESRVVVRWGQIGCVIDCIGIDAVAARRLQCDHRIPEFQSGKEIVAIVTPRLFLFNRDDFSCDRRKELLVGLFGRFYGEALVLWLAPEVLHPARGTGRED